MGTVIAGIVFIVLGILLWVGTVSLTHAFAIYLVVLGIALALFYVAPARYSRRNV